MRLLLALVFIQLTFLSCSKSREQHSDLPKSLQEMIAENEENCPVCGITISKMQWQGKTVYRSLCNGPACDCAPIYYDDKGTKMEPGYEEYIEINQNATMVKELWRCE